LIFCVLVVVCGAAVPNVAAPIVSNGQLWNGTESCSESCPSPSNFYPTYQLEAGQFPDTTYMKYKVLSGVNSTTNPPLFVPNMPTISLSYSNCVVLYYPYYDRPLLLPAGPYPVGTLTVRCDVNETSAIPLVGNSFNQTAIIDYYGMIVSYLYLPLNTSLPACFELLAHNQCCGIATAVRLLPESSLSITEIGIKSATSIPAANISNSFAGTYSCPINNFSTVSKLVVWNVDSQGFNLTVTSAGTNYNSVASFAGILNNETPTQVATPWITTPENQIFATYYAVLRTQNTGDYYTEGYFYFAGDGSSPSLVYGSVTCTLMGSSPAPPPSSSCGFHRPPTIIIKY